MKKHLISVINIAVCFWRYTIRLSWKEKYNEQRFLVAQLQAENRRLLDERTDMQNRIDFLTK